MPSAANTLRNPGRILVISALVMVLFFLGILLLGDFPKIDTQFYVNSIQAYEIVSSLTPSQFRAYRIMLFLDFFFPLAYGSFLFFSLQIIYQKLLKTRTLQALLLPFPVLALLFDLGENICTLTILKNYPQASDAAQCVGVFSALKWSSLGLALASGIAGLLVYAVRKSGFFGEFQ